MQRRKKVVSKAQFRFFKDTLRRIEAGGVSPIKDMSADELRAALDGVDYNALPERAEPRASKPRSPRPTPQPAPRLAPTFTMSVCGHDGAPVIDLQGYLDRHPQHPLNKVRKAVSGGFIVIMDPDDLPHYVLRTKTAVKAVIKADPRLDQSHVWSALEAQGFLASFGTVVTSLEETARAMAWCPACSRDIPQEEGLLMRRWPEKTTLPAELQGAAD